MIRHDTVWVSSKQLPTIWLPIPSESFRSKSSKIIKSLRPIHPRPSTHFEPLRFSSDPGQWAHWWLLWCVSPKFPLRSWGYLGTLQRYIQTYIIYPLLVLCNQIWSFHLHVLLVFGNCHFHFVSAISIQSMSNLYVKQGGNRTATSKISFLICRNSECVKVESTFPCCGTQKIHLGNELLKGRFPRRVESRSMTCTLCVCTASKCFKRELLTIATDCKLVRETNIPHLVIFSPTVWSFWAISPIAYRGHYITNPNNAVL